MYLTIEQLIKWFEQKLRFASNRYHTGAMNAEDVYQELLVIVPQQDFPFNPTVCRHLGSTLPINPAMVNRRIITKAIDIVRREDRRRQKFQIPLTCTVPESPHFTILHVRERFSSLQPLDQQIAVLLVEPTSDLIRLAQRKQEEARKDRERGVLRMHVHGEPVVTQNDIAAILGISKATVSRSIKRIREALAISA